MTPEEVREYAKNIEENGKKKGALGFFKGWYIKSRIRKIDRRIKQEAGNGGTFVRYMFSERLLESDKRYFSEYYRSQGYHVESVTYNMRVGWSVERPWWAK